MEKQTVLLPKNSKITIILGSECSAELEKASDEFSLKIDGSVTSAHFHFGPGPDLEKKNVSGM